MSTDNRLGAALISALVVIAGANAGATSHAPQTLGAYTGQYVCGTNAFGMELSLATNRKGEVEGSVDFLGRRFAPRTRARTRASKVRGTLSNAGQTFELRTDDRIRLTETGPDVNVLLRATSKPDGIFEGTLDYPGCSVIFVGRPNQFGRSPAADRYMSVALREILERSQDQMYADRRRERIRAGWIPAEIRGGTFSREDGLMDYYDASMGPDSSAYPEILPIEEASQALRSDGKRCLSSQRVDWDGNVATKQTETRAGGTGFYVVGCTGNCRGIKYEIWYAAAMYHYGRQFAVPVVTANFNYFRSNTIRWRFFRFEEVGPPPELVLYYWSPGTFSYGGGCRF